MASISNDPGGRRRLLFVAKDGKRKAVSLGKVSVRVAKEIKSKVESIDETSRTGMAMAPEVADWLGKIDDRLHAKLAAAGLVPSRQSAVEPSKRTTLGEWLDAYIAGRTDVAIRTRWNLEASKARLVEFFGADRPLEKITAGDADAWVIWLKGRGAAGTAGRSIGRAKQFFRAAVRKDLISKSPFADIRTPGQVNEARKFFVPLETAYAVLEACPDAEWRLLFALSRFGGLRCPSEHLAVKWTDVDWERDRFRVDSPKTGVRWVPIFPELRPYVEEAFELAAEGAVYVINRYRDANSNLRTQLNRIIRRAGLDHWPKLFHNLRASRETELAQTFPIHVVCKWIGHAAAIAQKHYLQVTDADFAKAAQKAAQYGAVSSRTEPQAKMPDTEKTAVCENMRLDASACMIGNYPDQDSNPELLVRSEA